MTNNVFNSNFDSKLSKLSMCMQNNTEQRYNRAPKRLWLNEYTSFSTCINFGSQDKKWKNAVKRTECTPTSKDCKRLQKIANLQLLLFCGLCV